MFFFHFSNISLIVYISITVKHHTVESLLLSLPDCLDRNVKTHSYTHHNISGVLETWRFVQHSLTLMHMHLLRSCVCSIQTVYTGGLHIWICSSVWNFINFTSIDDKFKICTSHKGSIPIASQFLSQKEVYQIALLDTQIIYSNILFEYFWNPIDKYHHSFRFFLESTDLLCGWKVTMNSAFNVCCDNSRSLHFDSQWSWWFFV